MLVFIVAVVFAIGMAYFATQNDSTVTINLLNNSWTNVPMYIVVTIALLVGFIIAWVLSMVSSIANVLTIKGKQNKLKEAQNTISELTKQVHKLEIENTRLSSGNHENPDDDDKSL